MPRSALDIAEGFINCIEVAGIVHVLDDLEWFDIVDEYVQACEVVGREPRKVPKGDIPRNGICRQLRQDLMMLELMEDDDPEKEGLLDDDDERLADL